jgi:chemotaxis protein CheX
MRADYINPFIKSLVRVFQTMLGCESHRGQLRLKGDGPAEHCVSGVIGLSGRAKGSVVLNFSEELALKAASTMLMQEMTEIDADVSDAIGELTNMVAGAAKAELAEYQLSLSLPNVITGPNHTIRFPSAVQRICVPFETPWGPVLLEVGLVETHESAPLREVEATHGN